MQADIEKVLIPQQKIAQRVRELAEAVTRDYAWSDEGVTIVPVMTGAMIFAADLIRCMPIRMKINLMTVSSYPGAAIRTQGANVLSKQLGDVHGCHVLLVDDILDSGGTLRLIVPMLKEMGASSVKICVLLHKDRPESRDIHADYMGFEIPDEFVVGYGLDFNSVYRNLPDICTLKPDVYASTK